MVPFCKIKKMEIFKLFNEWPKNTEKENKIKINKCECSMLTQQILDKDAIIKDQAAAMDETENKINYLNEENKELLSKIEQFDEEKVTIQEKVAAQNNEIAHLKLERDKFKEEADVATDYLKNVEFSFNDVHSKYERAKSLILDLKFNENHLQSCIELHEEAIEMLIEQYDALKNYSVQQFKDANNYVHTLKQESESVILHLQSKIRKLEVTTVALEKSLQQKNVESEQLSIICDDLINKQSSCYLHNVKDIVQAK